MSEGATPVAVVPLRVAPERSTAKPLLDGAVLLSGATLLSGVLAYAYHVVAARALGPEGYGLVAVLWAATFIGVVVLFRPLEQTTSRAFANRLAAGEEVRSVLRAVGLLYVVVSVGVVIAGAIAWSVVRDRIFLGDSLFTAALLVGVVVYGAAYVLRGICGGAGWFRGYALLLVADGATRLAVVVPLVVVASRDLAAAAVAAAAAGGLIAPLLVGRRVLGETLAQRGGARFRSRTAVAFAVPATVIAAADQILVNAGPLLVMVGGGDDVGEVAGLVFAATMLVRVPVFVFQGLATSLLPNLTRLQASADRSDFRRAIARTCWVLALCTAGIVAAAVVAGPESMALVYGPDYRVARIDLALLGTGVGAYMGMSAFAQALLAIDRGRAAAIAWTGAAVGFLALYAVIPGEPLFRVASSFAAATAVGVVAIGLVVGRERS